MKDYRISFAFSWSQKFKYLFYNREDIERYDSLKQNHWNIFGKHQKFERIPIPILGSKTELFLMIKFKPLKEGCTRLKWSKQQDVC